MRREHKMSECGELVFSNARLVLEDAVALGSLTIQGGRIAEVSIGPARASGLDCEGDLLLPGLVELHTDHLERELRPRKGVDWPALSALLSHDAKLAACGITTVLDAVVAGDTFGRQDRPGMLERSVTIVEEARSRAMLRADHHLHVRCEVGNSDVLPLYDRFGEGPLVRLVSLMDHTPGARQYADLERFRASLRNDHRLSEAEGEAYISQRQSLSDAHAAANRKAIAARASARGIVLATHDDAEPWHIEEAVALGATISEFPTTARAAQAARAARLTTILGAPNVVRGGSHNGNVAAAELGAADVLDALSSDYMPMSLIEAPFVLARDRVMTLSAALALVTVNPARMAGFEDRGRLEPGLRADLVRVRETSGPPIVRGVWREGSRVA
jgi:alpha-D-ribose 1-methylphosphonate 5-triphosphate diphosphatase